MWRKSILHKFGAQQLSTRIVFFMPVAALAELNRVPYYSYNHFFFPSKCKNLMKMSNEKNGEDLKNSDMYEPSLVMFSSYVVPRLSDVPQQRGIPLGMIVTPCGLLNVPPPRLHRPPIVCRECGSFINKFCETHISTSKSWWLCLFCASRNENIENYGDVDPNSFPELIQKSVEYVDFQLTDAQFVENVDTSTHTTPHLFVIDSNLSTESALQIRKSLRSTLSKLPSNTPIGLITFSNVVRVYALQCGDACLGEVIIGSRSPMREEFRAVISKSHTNIGPSDSVQHCIDDLIDSIWDEESVNKKNKWRRSRCDHRKPRCLGAALEVAVSLLSGTPICDDVIYQGGGQIVVMLGGSPNVGPGGITLEDGEQGYAEAQEECMEYYDWLANKAASQNIGVNIFCDAPRGVGVKILDSLVHHTGGHIVMLRNGFHPDVEHNLLNHMRLSTGMNASVSVRGSAPIRFAQVIGPLVRTAMQSDENNKHAERFASFILTSSQAKQSISMFYELSEDAAVDSLYFQFVVRFSTPDRQLVTRVTTNRLPTSSDPNTFLHSIDVDVLSTLFAKKHVLEARKLSLTSPPSSARKANFADENTSTLDESIYSLGISCGVQIPGTMERRFDTSEFQQLAYSLYQLRSGPLLSSVLQHPDDIDTLRTLLLGANVTDSLAMMIPSLWEVVEDSSTQKDEASTAETIPSKIQSQRSGCDSPSDIQTASSKSVTDDSPLLSETQAIEQVASEPQLLPSSQSIVHRDSPSLIPDPILTTEESVIPSPELVDAPKTISPEVPDITIPNNVSHNSSENAIPETSSESHISFLPLPPIDLCLHPCKILMMDTFFEVFIWIGSEVETDRAERLSQAVLLRVEHIIAHRYPRPLVMKFREGESMARYVQSRLIPSRKDNPSARVKLWPSIAYMSVKDIEQISNRLPMTEDLTYIEWLHRLRLSVL